ncbi:hypothetical protein NKR23_g3232 [Pleurostoma richardsiae]|uniref:Uncharacterized protein n=1 Tax=Pleurostoma richardsiae TaxID=41990 RepID=A0AA38VU59_9PEZI|nr:hypothetical protein NKR23_g3232 [Pleurostoma richardsiae]
MASFIASGSFARMTARIAVPRMLTTTSTSLRMPFTSSNVEMSTKSTPKSPGGKIRSDNPSYPAFSLSGLGISPRGRVWLTTGIVLLACIETATWVKFWPKITGREDSEDSG